MFSALTTLALLTPAQPLMDRQRTQRLAELQVQATALRRLEAPRPPQPDYQKLADETKWDWQPERANLTWYLTRFQGDCQVEVIKKPNTFGKLTVRFTKDDKPLLTLEGHYATAFISNEKVLYYAEYHPSSSGCALVAFDLAAGKELWKTHLKGIGPIDHTEYSNHVALDFVGNAVKVLGHEAAGDYVEFVDLKTGKTAGHKIFRKGFEE